MKGQRSVPVVTRAGVWLAWATCAIGTVLGSRDWELAGVVLLLAVPGVVLATLLVGSLLARRTSLTTAILVLMAALGLSLTLKVMGVA